MSDELLDFFDGIYCVNLDSRVDRWNSAQEAFKKLGIDDKVERFSAVECKSNLSRQKIAKDYYNIDLHGNLFRRRYPIHGAVGCATSHIEILKIAKSKNLKNVLVFEDDFKILDEYDKNSLLVLNELRDFKKSWELLYLGWEYDGKPRETTKSISKSNRGSKKFGLRTTRAIAYNENVFDKIIKSNPFNSKKYGRGGHIDFFYRRNTFARIFTRPALFGVHKNSIGLGDIDLLKKLNERNKNGK